MSELPPEGYPEGSRRVWGLTIKGAFYCETPTLRDHLMGTLQVVTKGGGLTLCPYFDFRWSLYVEGSRPGLTS